MSNPVHRMILLDLNEDYDVSDDVLHHIALGTAAASGRDFFRALVEHTAKALQADTVFVTKCTTADRSRTKTLAHWDKGAFAEEFEYDVADYPCVHVMTGQIAVQQDGLPEDYPQEDDNMESYIGIPLVSTKKQILGHLVVMNERPIDKKPRGLSALRIFAARAAAELERLQSETELVKSEARYRLLYDTNPLPIFVIDVKTHEILAVNRAAVRTYNYPESTLTSMQFTDLMPPEQHDRYRLWLGAPLESDHPWDCVFEQRLQAGRSINVQVSRRFLLFEGRSACLVLVNDISERKRIEEERDHAYQTLEHRVAERTRELEQRQQIANSLRDALAAINSQRSLSGILDYIADQASHLLKADSVVMCQYLAEKGQCLLRAQRGLPDHILSVVEEPPGWDLIRQHMSHSEPVIINNGIISSSALESSLYRPQFQALLAVPLVIQEAVYGYLILYFLDPHDFSEDEIGLSVSFADHMALAIDNSRLRQEAERSATLEERNRLARDLHDAVTQTLWSASLLADILPGLWARDPERATVRLDQLRQLNRVALAEMRALLLELRPKALTESRLEDLLRQLIDTTELQAALDFQFQVEGELADIPGAVQIAYYRIAQEALNNVIRHAQATQVILRLLCDDQTAVVMSIADNGQGFDPTTTKTQSFGTKIMQERADAIDATLSIDSAPTVGTTVTLKWTRGGSNHG